MNTLKPWWNRLGLQRRIMAYVVVGVVVLFSGLAYFDLLAVRDMREQIFRERLALANSLSHDIDQDFEFLASDIRMAAEGIKPPAEDFSEAAERLFRSLGRHASSQFFSLSFVGIVDEQGTLLAGMPERLQSPSPSHTEQVQLAMKENRSSVLCSQISKGIDVSFATVVVPVASAWTNGRNLAVVADTIGVSGVPPAIPGGGTGYSLEILETDGHTVLSTSNPGKVGQVSPYYPAVLKYSDAKLGGVEMYYAHGDDLDNTEEVIALAPLPSGPFYLVLKQPANMALLVPRRRQNEMLVVAVIGSMIALVLAWYTARSVVKPVTELRATARGFALGRLDSPVRVAAQDELAELAEDIEVMRQQLKKNRNEIERAKQELELKVVERTRRLHETLGKVFTTQEEERRRLARELHDEQSQSLGALSVSIDRIGRLIGPGSSPVHAELEQARNMARSLLQETRKLIYDLRPTVLDDMGLEAAIRWCAETHLEKHGVQVALKSSLTPERLPGEIEVALFRVAQEAIVNIERHARAPHASVVLEQVDSLVRMRIWDDGIGFVSGQADSGHDHSGVGLEGMSERAGLIGGKLGIQSEPGKGTTISIEVPLD